MGAYDAVIEIPRGSRVKYEVDHGTGRVFLDRMLFTRDRAIPPTTASSRTPSARTATRSTCSCCSTVDPVPRRAWSSVRPVGVLKMSDEAGGDDKLVAVLAKDPRWSHIQDLDDIPEYTKKEIDALLRALQGPRAQQVGQGRRVGRQGRGRASARRGVRPLRGARGPDRDAGRGRSSQDRLSPGSKADPRARASSASRRTPRRRRSERDAPRGHEGIGFTGCAVDVGLEVQVAAERVAGVALRSRSAGRR